MGVSTDAILFYGFPVDDGGPNHEIICGSDLDADDELDEDEIWRRKFALPPEVAVWQHQDKYPVTVGTHCSGDCPLHYVAVKKSEITASRGYPEEIKSLDVNPKWDRQLLEFCKVWGLKPPKKFGRIKVNR